MKKFKKIMALVLAGVMTLSMSMTVFADGETPAGGETPAAATTANLTITHQDGITDAADHTYKAYQILTGDVSGEQGTSATANGYTLANMKWGTNAPTGKTPGAELTATEVAEVKAWTADTVKALTLQGTSSVTATKNDDGDYVFSGLTTGYYLVKDETNLGTNEKNDANSAIIIQVVGDTTVQTKRSIPEVDKQVYDDEETAWSDAADHDLYESFQFKLIATIPADADYAAYPTYAVTFHDTMSVGVAFESIASVKVGTTPVPEAGYTCTATAAANNGDAESSWTINIADIKEYVDDLSAGTTVEVIYNAHLTNKVATYYKESADTATPSNNKVYLEYSNNPNGTGTGKTKEDTVWVFSYEVDNTKVDGSNNNAPLAGAGFRLYNGATEVGLIYDESISAYRPVKEGETAVEMKSAETTGKFDIKGLDPGTYTLKETTTPTGYSTMPDKTIEIAATTVENTDGASAKLTMTKNDTTNQIINEKGATLPSTGGMGTTLFYIVGAVLMIGAGVLLVTRRRMSAQ